MCLVFLCSCRRLKLEVNVVDKNPDSKVTFLKEVIVTDSSTGLITHTFVSLLCI